MKCPKRFNIVQRNINEYLYDEESRNIGHSHIFVETQNFANCYEEECMAWDCKKRICKEVRK